MPIPPLANHLAPDFSYADSRLAGSARNMQQLVLLRWIAIVGQILAITTAYYLLHIPLPLGSMLLVAGWLTAFNIASLLYQRLQSRSSEAALLFALLVDIAALTAQLYLSGGIVNPFVFLYLLQVVLAAVLLRPQLSWFVMMATTLCAVGLAHWHGLVTLTPEPAKGLADPYIQGLLLCYVLIASLLVVFIGRIAAILQARDARLAALRQQTAEKEHIVRMGLLASGAAHELGTPLATMAVILGDWQHLPHFTSDPELLGDVAEMQAQVLRCKAIVTGILQSAGEIRAEAPRETTLRAFIDEMVAEWQRSRPAITIEYDNRIQADAAIVADTGLQQMLFNILDNAQDASPEYLELDVWRDEGMLLLCVRDHGPGFSAEMLEPLGKPYQSTKNAPGRGLGLFLSMNVARALGGSLRAENMPEGGAHVCIALPLQALLLEEDHDHG